MEAFLKERITKENGYINNWHALDLRTPHTLVTQQRLHVKFMNDYVPLLNYSLVYKKASK